MQRYNGRCQRTGQKSYSPLEGSLMAGGADMGGGNNIFLIINDRVPD